MHEHFAMATSENCPTCVLLGRVNEALTGPEPAVSDLVELLRQCRDAMERVV
jgi:hypothetical protein